MSKSTNKADRQYLEHMKGLIHRGALKGNRTGVETYSIFGHQMRFDLREGFPLLTTKKLFTKAIIHELLWFLKGDTNIKYLKDNGVSIWDEWADEDGNLGPVYGQQWRSWPSNQLIDSDCPEEGVYHHDQLWNLIDRLKEDPDCRRMIVSAWNVAELNDMALAPCHCLFQFHTELIPLKDRLALAPDWSKLSRAHDSEKMLHEQLDKMGLPGRYLSCQLYQRSADWFLGVPFNMASYSLLTMMVAQVVNMVPKEFIHSFGDTHLYENHTKQAWEQLGRADCALPTMQIKNRGQEIDQFKYEDFTLSNYNPAPSIAAPIAV